VEDEAASTGPFQRPELQSFQRVARVFSNHEHYEYDPQQWRAKSQSEQDPKFPLAFPAKIFELRKSKGGVLCYNKRQALRN
jgi:hypothetical protein